ncbi:DUF3696 domain-containing protein [Nonomuraea angiospora]|uniref:DUF3696 domain-containing protein n=1 Tax=Nonomuraea angiospora TaxID=46172 RepID=UPI0029AEAA97|nr:DUF3696 domain-containing protein [Nonomuraea angiospora]MDX3107440.1 DUF3696 domain-containing protein [Nonomuraea angiospora]
MALARISLRNYRCFATKQEIELCPITVILGKNNSGKSALVRAPMVMATGIRSNFSLPLDLVQFGEDAPEFIDLVHQRLELSSISVGLDLVGSEGQLYALKATIQNVVEWNTQRIRDWSLHCGTQSATYEWFTGLDSEGSEQHPYRRPNNVAEPVWLELKGLLPTALPGDDGVGWYDPERIRSAFDVIRYLGPFRAKPRRLVRLPAREPEQNEFGSRTEEILIYDHVRRKGLLIKQINQYLRDQLPVWELEVRSQLDGYAVGLRSRTNPELWVPATDSGTGIAQLLPFLVRRAQDEVNPPGQDVLEVIEEPELHLHPSAQSVLADLYIRAIRNERVRFLVETHSETFLLRLRRRVAEGKLNADKIAFYFIDSDGESSTVKKINIDEFGNVDYWPKGIFEENFEEVRALAEAQEDRMDDAR